MLAFTKGFCLVIFISLSLLFTVYLYYYKNVLYEDVLSLPGILNIYSVLNSSFCHRDIPHIDFYNLELGTIEYNLELKTIEYNPKLETNEYNLELETIEYNPDLKTIEYNLDWKLLNIIQSWKLLNIIQSWKLLNII